jgi:hypothetical protein
MAITMVALRRERMDRALKTIKRVALTFGYDFKRFVVIVTANFAACHGSSPHVRWINGPALGIT